MTTFEPAFHLQGRKLVTIVGGGFAGLNIARRLAGHKNVQVLLLDEKNHHLFQPLLYQVATAGLNPADIAIPIRSRFSKAANVEVHLGRVEGVNLSTMTLQAGDFEIKSDFIVLACGAMHSYFHHSEWEEFAPGLKTLEQATEIRRRMLLAFERAENEIDPEIQRELLTFVIVGGGPTGVELAGAFADISKTVLLHDFRRINPSDARIVLIEGGPRVLASFHPDLSEQTARDLNDLGVEVITGKQVDHLDAEGVSFGNDRIQARSVFWAAGVRAQTLHFAPEVETDRSGRVKVANDFSVPGFPDAFVVGDMAAFETEPNKILPGVATVAIQGGRFVAEAILKTLRNERRTPFAYFDKGTMATIGKNRAVVESGKLRLHGRIAWFAWLFVHIYYLVGFQNRLSVLSHWAWSYIFSRRGARLITSPNWRLDHPESASDGL